MIRERLRESKSVVLDGSGDGNVLIGPVRSGQSWQIERMTVFIVGGVGANSGAECQVFHGLNASDANLIDGTTRAGMDVSELPHPFILEGGEHILFAFSGGSAAARATATVQGYRVVG